MKLVKHAALSLVFMGLSCSDYSASIEDAGKPVFDGDGGTVLRDGSIPDAAAREAGTGAFTFLGFAPESCPATATAGLCNAWPLPAQGSIYLYKSQETFGGKTRERSFHVYIPANLTGPTAVLLVLHDGGRSGSDMLLGGAGADWLTLADMRGASTWYPNHANCKHPPTYVGPGAGYTSDGASGGSPCTPAPAAAANSMRFIVVLPDGLADTGASKVGYHWEDGRVPSPGQQASGADSEVTYRDDVGFIDHVIRTVAGDPAGAMNAAAAAVPAGIQIDATRISITGHHDGGMMTLRLACEANSYPNLARVSAFAATGAQLPEPLARGTQGRRRCGSGTMTPYGLMLLRGINIATPDCPTAGCASPTVSGDGIMPFGTSGLTHFVAMNEKGKVASGADTKTLFQNLFSGFGAMSTNGDQFGFYSEVEWNVFGTSTPRIWTYQANGGAALDKASRGDWNAYALVWQFVSSFRKSGGVLSYETPTWVGGNYRL